MTTYDSIQYALTQAVPASKVDVNTWGGRVRARFAQYEGTTGVAQNDLLNLFPIRKGERPLFFQVYAVTDQAASVTIDIGVSGTENKYVSALDISTTAASYHTVLSLSTDVETANAVVQLKWEGANPTDVATIKVVMYYMVD